MEIPLLSRIKNSDQKFPAIYYGLHMVPGVAEYADGPGGQPYRVFISGDTAKKIDPTFATCPIYVEHVDDEQPNAKNKTVDGVTQDDKGNAKIQTADGYVIESFYNPPDGNHWAKFIVTSEEGVRAIDRGWKLSNCYQPLNLGAGGEWHGVSYSREFVDAEYRHLAIVPNPRYRESIIFTPEQFKEYNLNKVKEIAALRNSADVQPKKPSQGDEKMRVSLLDRLFGRKNGKIEKIENAAEIGKIEVSLGKNRRLTIAELVANAEKMKDEDYDKLMSDSEDRPEHNDDAKDDKENDLADLKKEKNKKKSDDDDVENDLEDLKKDKKNKKKADDDDDTKNDDTDDEKMKALRAAKNKKKSSEEDDEKKDNEDDDKKDNDDDDDDKKENDESNPLKHVIMLDDEETTVEDLINSHVGLKNKYNTLLQKHNDLKEAHVGILNKFGDDDAFNSDADFPKEDKAMQEALGQLENEEKALEESLEKRKNQITKVIGKMKNAQEAIEKREQKKEEGVERFNRLKNAELQATLDAEGPVMATETSASMVQRGKARYGSNN